MYRIVSAKENKNIAAAVHCLQDITNFTIMWNGALKENLFVALEQNYSPLNESQN